MRISSGPDQPPAGAARPKRIHGRIHAVGLRVLEVGEDVLHGAVGLVLFVLSGITLVETVKDLVHPYRQETDASGVTHKVHMALFPEGAIQAISNVLFVVIILEILRTVTAHFTDKGFQLKPFLAIGVVSSVRHILTTSARLTLEGEGSESEFRHSITELGVNAGVVILLVIGLVLLHKFHELAEDD